MDSLICKGGMGKLETSERTIRSEAEDAIGRILGQERAQDCTFGRTIYDINYL